MFSNLESSFADKHAVSIHAETKKTLLISHWC